MGDINKNLLVGVVGAFVAIILGYFIIDSQATFREHGERIRALEKDFEHYIRDKGKDLKFLDNFPFEYYVGSDRDENGNNILSVEIDILTESYRWKCASVEEIVRVNRTVDFNQVIQGFSSENHLIDALEVVCIGTASYEGDVLEEEKRAARRVETLINLTKDNIEDNSISIWGMNFGKFMSSGVDVSCSDATLDQRRIVLIKVVEKKSGMSEGEFEESLKRIFVNLAESNDYTFPIDIRDYSNFKSKKPMLVYGRRGLDF